MELIQKEKPIAQSKKRRLRWLRAGAAVASFCLISPVWALGVGALKTESTLHEPLNAKIALLGVVGDELDSLTIRLANPDVYERMGIERNELLDQLVFKIEDPQGQEPFIRVTSKNAINEPFVNFLVEINWAAGRLLREFTVLLDPTATAESAKPSAIEEAKVENIPEKTPAPSIETESTADIPVSPKVKTSATSAGGKFGAGRSTTLGPVKRGQNLWKIAESIKPNNVTIEQAMLTLFKKNPDAFFGNNISMLKAGAILRVGNDKDFMKISIDEAREEVSRHDREWLAYRREKMAERALASESTTSKPIGTPKSPFQERVPTGESRLELVTPSAQETEKTTVGNIATDDTATKKSSDLKVELAMTNELLEAANKENQELKGRINRLENQLKSMRGLLDIKNRDLTDAQGEPIEESSRDSTAKIDMLEESEPTPIDDGEGKEKKAELSLLNDPITIATLVGALALLGGFAWILRKRTMQRVAQHDFAEPVAFKENRRAGDVERIDDQEKLPDEYAAEKVFGGDSYAASSPKEIDSEIKPVSRPTLTASEMKLLEPNEENPADEKFDEYIDRVSMAISKPELAEELDEVLSEPGRLDREDSGIDIMAEADVYIAYGKYTKAEDVLKTAIAIDPDRHELKLKLLEVYVFSEERDAFLEKSEELFAALKGDKQHPIWKRVISYAQELGLSNPIFETSKAVVEGPVDEIEPGDLDFLSDTRLSSGVARLSEQQAPSKQEKQDSIPVFKTSKPSGFVEEQTMEEKVESEIVDDFQKSDVPVFGASVVDHTLDEDVVADRLDELARDDWTPEQVKPVSKPPAPLMPDTEFEPKDTAGFSPSLSHEIDEAVTPDLPVVEIPASQFGRSKVAEPSGVALSAPQISEPIIENVAEDFGDQSRVDAGVTEPAVLEAELAAIAESVEQELVEPGEQAASGVIEQAIEEAPAAEIIEPDVNTIIREDLESTEQTPFIPSDVFVEDIEPEGLTRSEPSVASRAASKPSKQDSKPVFVEPPEEAMTELEAATQDEPIMDIGQSTFTPSKSGSENSFFLLDDEVDTKLDLARAYIEMGDKDGAVDLLTEVLDEGDDRQKKEANDLMSLTKKQTAVS